MDFSIQVHRDNSHSSGETSHCLSEFGLSETHNPMFSFLSRLTTLPCRVAGRDGRSCMIRGIRRSTEASSVTRIADKIAALEYRSCCGTELADLRPGTLISRDLALQLID